MSLIISQSAFQRLPDALVKNAVMVKNAAYETGSILNAHRGGDTALLRLADCYEVMGLAKQAEDYRAQAAAWRLPE